jgi:hypothetical protein
LIDGKKSEKKTTQNWPKTVMGENGNFFAPGALVLNLGPDLYDLWLPATARTASIVP